MDTSKRHHYVPQAILRKFCFRGETTYYTRIDSHPRFVSERNIRSIFTRRHYNSLQSLDGKRDDKLEKFFANKLDNFIPEWLDTFSSALKKGDFRFQSMESRSRFIQFFYNHMKRNPDFNEPITKQVFKDVFSADLEAEFENKHRKLTPEEKSNFDDPDWRSNILSNARVYNIGEQGENVLNTLSKMQIFVATPEREAKQFIVGSNPVVRFENYPKQHLGTKGVELWTTLTPRIAVGFSVPNGNHNIIELNDKQVRTING